MSLDILLWIVAPLSYGLLSAGVYLWVRPKAIPTWRAYFRYALRFIAVAYLILLFLRWLIM